MFEKIKARYIEFILTKYKFYLPAIIIIALVSVPLLFSIKSENSVRIWYKKSHPAIKQLDKFERTFGGGGQNIAIGVYHEGGVVNKESMKLISEITNRMAEVYQINRVESITTLPNIQSEGNDISFKEFWDDGNDFDAEKIKSQIKEQFNTLDHVINSNLDMASIFAYTIPSSDNQIDQGRITNETEALLSEYKDIPGYKFTVLGSVPATHYFSQITLEDNELMIPLSFGFIILLLLFIFREFKAVFVPVVLSGLTIYSAFCFLSVFHIEYNGMLGAIPGILLAICIADSVHIFTTYYEKLEEFESDVAIKKSLELNFVPTLLTSVSTAISFISISFTDIVPINSLGVVIAFGTMVAWFLTLFLVGGTICVLPSKRKQKKTVQQHSSGESKSTRYTHWLKRHRTSIIAIFALFFGICVYQFRYLVVDADPIGYFSENTKIKKDVHFFESHVDGTRFVDLVVETNTDGGAKDKDFLQRLKKYLLWIQEQPYVVKTKSLVNILERMNEVFDKSKSIPENQKTIAELLFLYEISVSSGQGLNTYLSVNGATTRITIFWNITRSKEGSEKILQIIEGGKQFGINAHMGGEYPIYTFINDSVVTTFFKSMAMALVLVMLMIFAIFRNPLVSIISMLPNLVPLVFGAAMVHFMGLYLDMGTSIVATICLGIAIDDTIHFISQYLSGLKQGLSVEESIIYCFEHTGSALVYTSVILVFGFGIFFFADFVPNKNFGMLTAMSITVALIADLILLPALILKIRKAK